MAKVRTIVTFEHEINLKDYPHDIFNATEAAEYNWENDPDIIFDGPIVDVTFKEV